MKLSMIVYLFISLFGAGFVFLRLNCHFAGRRFALTLKKAAASVWISVLFSVMSGALHHQGMLLGEHLIFDAIGTLFVGVILSCGIALAKELLSARSRRSTAHRAARRRADNVIAIPQKRRAASCSRRKAGRIAA